MTAVLAAAGRRPPPATRQEITAGIIAAAALLRSDRGMLAGSIATTGPRQAALDLRWSVYRGAVAHALALAGQLYNDEATGQLPALESRTSSVPLVADAQRWVNQRTDLIVSQTQMALLAVAAYAAARRMDPWATAGLLNRAAGLNRPQALAVAAMRPPVGMKQGAVSLERAPDRLAESYLRGRADLIGATETHAAAVAGAVDTWMAVLTGQNRSESLILQWSGGTCDVCAPLDGTTAPLDTGFDVGLPPVHPHCSCGVDLVDVSDQEAAA